MKSSNTSIEHVTGNPNASLELMEYADYQCPYCAQAYYIVKEIQQRLGDKMYFTFRNFPLPELHPYAIHAAITAEVAGAHGKFWEMHDMLFENQKSLEDPFLITYARNLGIDVEVFMKDFQNDIFFQKINKDYENGIKNGVQGTPTFFINGVRFEGDWTDPSFIDYLESLTV